MDDHRRHQEMMVEGGSEQSSDRQIDEENSQGTPVFSSQQKPSSQSSFFPDPNSRNQAHSKKNCDISFSNQKQESIGSLNSCTKGKSEFTFQFNDFQMLDDTPIPKSNNANNNIGLSLDIQAQKENTNTLIQPLPAPPKKKGFLELTLPVNIIQQVQKETLEPEGNQGNSQKKKQNVFDFFDNFHEYTVFCDVAMKKCSREKMEDRFQAVSPLDSVTNSDAFFAVYDGHGTTEIAELVKEKLHKYIIENQNYHSNVKLAVEQSFSSLDKYILQKQEDKTISHVGGTTALCCLIRGEKFYIINCGDSLSALVTNEYKITKLNQLHKPSQIGEQEKLMQKNAIFTTQRVGGSLNVTRTLGDYIHKEWIISEPEIHEFDITEGSKYLFLGTDGFWDIINPEKLVELLKKRENTSDTINVNSNVKDLSTYFIEIASREITAQKKDNMTLLAVDLSYYFRQFTDGKENSPSENMLGSNCVMCTKSQQIQSIKINTEISSYIFQVKSPHSVGRSTEKRSTLTSLTQKQFQQQVDNNKTCSKQTKRKFFGSENTEEESNKSDEMQKFNDLVLHQRESIRPLVLNNGNSILQGNGLTQSNGMVSSSSNGNISTSTYMNNEADNITTSVNFMNYSLTKNDTVNQPLSSQNQNGSSSQSPKNMFSFQFPISNTTNNSNSNSNNNNNTNSNNNSNNNNNNQASSRQTNKQPQFFQF